MSETRFAIITTVIVILSYIVAMTVSSLATVLAYVGSTGSTSISFILPGLFYYKISDPDSPQQQKLQKAHDDNVDFGREPHVEGDEEDAAVKELRESQWKKKLLRRLSLALAIYGVCVMITCLITNTFFIASAKH
jgi:amino acid permease